MIAIFVQRGSTGQKIDIAIALENSVAGSPYRARIVTHEQDIIVNYLKHGHYVDRLEFIAAVKLTFHASVAD